MKNAKKWLVPVLILVVIVGLVVWSYNRGPVAEEGADTTEGDEAVTTGSVEVVEAPPVTTGMLEIMPAE